MQSYVSLLERFDRLVNTFPNIERMLYRHPQCGLIRLRRMYSSALLPDDLTNPRTNQTAIGFKCQKLIPRPDVADQGFCSVCPEDLAVGQKAPFVVNDDSLCDKRPARADEQVISGSVCSHSVDGLKLHRIKLTIPFPFR